MKRYISVILRLLFAVAGIAYIAISLTWTDSVAVPKGTHQVQLASEPTTTKAITLDKPQNWRVIEGDVLGDEGNLTLRTPDATATMIITREQMGGQITQFRAKPGVTTTLEHAKFGLLLIGLLIVCPIYFVQSYRWWLLMKARGLTCSMGNAFRLTMVGTFFNFCMPGTTGGDLVKAWYASKNSDRRADSVMTVVVDRVTGLLGLFIMAALAGLFMVLATQQQWLQLSAEQMKVTGNLTLWIWLGLGAAGVGALFYFSRRIRRKLGINWNLVKKLPGHKLMVKVDDAALAYKQHLGVVAAAVLLSLPVHLALSGATALAGYALGMETPLGLLLTVIPVLFLAAAVPLTFQGLGVMEGLAMVMIAGSGATENQIVGMLLVIRFYQIFYALLGSLFLLGGNIHLHPERDEAAATVSAEPAKIESAGDGATPASPMSKSVAHIEKPEPAVVA